MRAEALRLDDTLDNLVNDCGGWYVQDCGEQVVLGMMGMCQQSHFKTNTPMWFEEMFVHE